MEIELDFVELSNILKIIDEKERYLILGYISGLVGKKVLEKYEKNKETDSEPELAQ